MTPLSSNRPQAAYSPAQKTSARVIPLMLPHKKFARWRWAAAGGVLLLGIAGGAMSWWLRDQPVETDAEDSSYAEVIQPAPTDVVAPRPILPNVSPDKRESALAIPASALQLPAPPPPRTASKLILPATPFLPM